MATHYETLGLGRGATDDEVRRAYLRLARLLHPDRQIGAPPDQARRAAQEMREVNEAWRVLRDPDRRSGYDRSLVAPAPAPTPAAPDPDDVVFRHAPADPDDLGVKVLRGLPWLVLAFVLGVIFVFTAFAGGSDSAPSGYDLAGECVETQAGRPRPVPCEPGVDQVVLVVTRASLCTNGSSATSYGDEWLCLRRFAG